MKRKNILGDMGNEVSKLPWDEREVEG